MKITGSNEGSGTILEVTEEFLKAGLHGVPDEWKVSKEARPTGAEYESADIPVIDLSQIGTDRAGLAKKLGAAAKEWGAFVVVNHGLSLDLMQAMETQALNFFGLPAEEKSKLGTRGNLVGSYYTGNNITENLHSMHWAESYVVYLQRWCDLNLKVIDDATRDWPRGNEEFKFTLSKYVSGIKTMSEQLAQLAGESLGLDSSLISKASTGLGSVTIRANYYPACPYPEDVLGAHSHTDPAFLTVVQQDKVGGLQFEKDGRWFGIKPIEGAFVVNVADTCHIWSNGIFKSVLHRVLVNKNVPRISIASVLALDDSFSLSPTEGLVDEKHPQLYKNCTSGDYMREIFKARQKGDDHKRFDGEYTFETLKIKM